MNKIVVLNHKMSLLYDDLYNYIERTNNLDTESNIIICPSNIYLEAFINNSVWPIGTQNIHYSIEEGHTGEVSTSQVKSLGVEYTIIGHNDRVTEFNENKNIVNMKLSGALDSNIIPLLCFGEDIDEDYHIKLPELLNAYLKDIENIKFIIFAYEPINAIGTGTLPSIEKISEITKFISKYLEDKYHTKPNIIYGGSVDSSNIHDIINIDSINGVLIGAISSNIKEVEKIIKNIK